ncbi:MAG TPA: SgcJ/EcaC family oxidoreductase [Chromatiales bacterium]|nr:SgcJ/EcaC family oxidoreductase [Chromatiales bacterium]
MWKRIKARWNTHDPSAVAAFFSEDADLVMGNLPAAHGRQEIRDSWQAYFARQEPERRLTLEVSPVRFLAADAAIINVATTTGGRDRQGQELPARKFRGTWLWYRQSNDWLISAMRGFPTEEDRVELTPLLKTAEYLKPQIRALIRAYEDAFGTHDPAAISEFYTDDADIVVRNSPVIHGRPAILEWWRAYFSELRPQSLDRIRWFESMRTILIIDEVRMIAPDVALVNITATAAARQADSEPSPVRYARATWVLVREDGEWLIAALRVLPSEEDRIIRAESR